MLGDAVRGFAVVGPSQSPLADGIWVPARAAYQSPSYPVRGRRTACGAAVPSSHRRPASEWPGCRLKPAGTTHLGSQRHKRLERLANADLVPAIPTTGLAWSGGIIPQVGLNGTLLFRSRRIRVSTRIRTKRWDGRNDRSDSSHSAAWSQKNMSYQSYRANDTSQPGDRDDMTSSRAVHSARERGLGAAPGS